jgi:ribose transport system permease protein
MSYLRREFGMFTALVLICAGLWISNPSFLGQSNIQNTTRQIAMLGIFGIGIAFVIITGGIDLSVGSIIGLTGVIIAKISSPEEGCLNYPLWVGIAIALGIALLIGLVQGLLITMLNLQPFVITLAFMLILRGVSQTIVQGGTLGFGSSDFTDMANNGLFVHNGSPLLSYPLLIFFIVAILFAYILHFTVFGRYVYAIGGNREAARYSGINVKLIETITYMISAGLAGVAGILYASYIGQMSQQVGISYELYAIAGAVIGGCSLRGGEGTIIGVIIGCAVMRVIDNGINMFQFKHHTPLGIRIWRLDQNWTQWIIGSVILLAVVLDQVAHLLQSKRRTQKVVESTPSPAPAPNIVA